MLYTTKQLINMGGYLNHNQTIITVKKNHTINWYREVSENVWENYHCTSEY